ncbi:MAG: TolC family protein [Acidobacteria bacterium]|nr:TolC family protein [Acidobacteriota bacterium]
MKRFLAGAVLALVGAASAVADTQYRIELRGKPAVVSKDKPVERGTMLLYHRAPDGVLTSVPREDVLRVEAFETASASPRSPAPAAAARTAAGPTPARITTPPATRRETAVPSVTRRVTPTLVPATTPRAAVPAGSISPGAGPPPKPTAPGVASGGRTASVPAEARPGRRRVSGRPGAPVARRAEPPASGAAFGQFAPPSAPVGPYAPPEPAGERIRLADAVRRTLDLQPQIQLARQDVALRLGLYQEALGFFDSAVVFMPSYDRAIGFLLRGPLTPEVQRRYALKTLGDVLAQVATDIETSLAQGKANSYKYFGPCSGSTFTVNGVTICLDVSGTNIQPSVVQGALARRNFEDVLAALAANDPNAAERADIQAAQKRYNDFYADLLTRFDAGAREVSGRAYESLARLGPLPRNDIRDTLTLDLRYDIPLHNGLIVSPIILAQGLRNNFEGKSDTASFGGRGIPTSYTAVLGFSVDAPLLRGFGYVATEAALRAAKLNYEASLDFLAQIASQSVRDTLQAYWRLAAAEERFTLLDRSAGAQGRIHQLSEALVQGDEIPRAELDRVRARRAEAEAAVAGARGALANARVDLARAIGLDVTAMGNAPLAADSLPEAPSAARLDEQSLRDLVEGAVRARGDVKSLRERERAADALVQSARVNLRPSLGVTLQADYRSRFEAFTRDAAGNVSDTARSVFYLRGYKNAFGGKYTGPSFQVNLRLALPFKNNVQRGLLLQAESSLASSGIAARDLERTVQANTVQAANSARESAREAERRRAAAGYYEETIRNSFEQYRSGEISLLDAILTERDLTSALLDSVSARQTFASDVTRLRFETGSLLPYSRTDRDITFGEVDPRIYELTGSR